MINEEIVEKAIKAYNEVDGGLTLYPNAMRNALEASTYPCWQSIDTAPTDGTEFLGSWFNPFKQDWTIQPMKYLHGTWRVVWDGYEEATPQRWMPMPEDPK